MMFRRPSSFFSLFFSLGVFAFWPGFAFAAPSVFPNDTFWDKQWYLRQVHAPEAWAVATGSPSVIVAIIDGGVDSAHPDLQGSFWTNTKEIPGDGTDNDQDGFVDDVHGWNFVTNNSDVRPVWKKDQAEDAWSHGTMVASLLAARGNDDIGIAGMAWNVKIMPLVVLDADGEGSVADMLTAIRYAVSHGASVINLSLVGYDYEQELDRLIQNAAAAGVVIVAATGNDSVQKAGVNIDEIPAYPACFDGTRNSVLGVSGTDTLDQKAPYANFGKTCTDVSAPAQELFVARPSYPHDQRPTSSVPGYTDKVTGTSLAAPLVSGVAALLKSVRPAWTSAQIRERIIQTADPIDDGLPEVEKQGLGFGRLNAGRALAGLSLFSAATASSSFAFSFLSTHGPWAAQPLKEGMLWTSARSSWVGFEHADPVQKKSWQPYGPLYRGGVQTWFSSTTGQTVLWPTHGGGHAFVLDGKGIVRASLFPFGKARVGAWKMKASGDELSVSGPKRFVGRLFFSGQTLQAR